MWDLSGEIVQGESKARQRAVNDKKKSKATVGIAGGSPGTEAVGTANEGTDRRDKSSAASSSQAVEAESFGNSSIIDQASLESTTLVSSSSDNRSVSITDKPIFSATFTGSPSTGTLKRRRCCDGKHFCGTDRPCLDCHAGDRRGAKRPRLGQWRTQANDSTSGCVDSAVDPDPANGGESQGGVVNEYDRDIGGAWDLSPVPGRFDTVWNETAPSASLSQVYIDTGTDTYTDTLSTLSANSPLEPPPCPTLSPATTTSPPASPLLILVATHPINAMQTSLLSSAPNLQSTDNSAMSAGQMEGDGNGAGDGNGVGTGDDDGIKDGDGDNDGNGDGDGEWFRIRLMKPSYVKMECMEDG